MPARWFTPILPCLCFSWCATAISADGTAPVIDSSLPGKRSEAVGQATPASTAPASKVSATPPANPKELHETLRAIGESKEASQRVAALKKLQVARLTPVPKEVSVCLFKSAVLDDAEEVRKEAAQSIKSLEDKEGMRFLAGGALHPNLEPKKRKRAAEAIRRIDHPAAVSYVIHHVTYNINTTAAIEPNPPETRAIVNPAIPITLPIELPSLELRHIETSVVALAFSALRTISRRDFGNDPAAWGKWFGEWQHIRDVRLVREAKP